MLQGDRFGCILSGVYAYAQSNRPILSTSRIVSLNVATDISFDDPFPFFDNNLSSTTRSFVRDLETAMDRRRRVARERSRAAIQTLRRVPPEALEERLFHRPRRTGRACGSRHRVMLC